MGGKRGKAATITILAAITLASFVVWLIPQSPAMTIITTDYAGALDSAGTIRQTLQDELVSAYDNMLEGSVSSQEYVERAQIISDQVTDQIRALAAAEPASEWKESYGQYVESLRALNSMIRETVVLAGTDEADPDYPDMVQRIRELGGLAEDHAARSDAARP